MSNHSAPDPDDRIVEVRLVSAYYHNRIEYEEGPGSASDVVSDVNRSYLRVGRMSVYQAESMTRTQLYYEFGIDIQGDSEDEYDDYADDGSEEVHYSLEYLDPETRTWRFVANLWN